MGVRYRVIPRTLIFIFHDNRVLLIRGADTKKNFPGLYNGLGGHVEHGETILAGAVRELFEESGISETDLELCGISVDSTQPDVGVEVHIFRGEVSEAPQLIDSDEGALVWVGRDQLASLPAVPDLIPFLDRIWDRKRGDRIFYARANWKSPTDEQLYFS